MRVLPLSCLLLLALSAVGPVADADEKASGETTSAQAAEASSHDSAAADADSGHAEAGHDAHGGGHETGVPGFKADLALWSLVVFVCFLFVLRKAAWGPLIEGLDKRESGIRNSIAQAEESHRKAKALLAEYDVKLKNAEQTVQGMIAEAKRDAERTSQDLIAAAQKEVNAIRERAREDIGQARDAALAEVFTTLNSQIVQATEHVLGRTMTDGDQDRLVREALAGVSR